MTTNITIWGGRSTEIRAFLDPLFEVWKEMYLRFETKSTEPEEAVGKMTEYIGSVGMKTGQSLSFRGDREYL
ncbi:hypothetical protein TWF281_004040 [Arthrobotrys megalospora]